MDQDPLPIVASLLDEKEKNIKEIANVDNNETVSEEIQQCLRILVDNQLVTIIRNSGETNQNGPLYKITDRGKDWFSRQKSAY